MKDKQSKWISWRRQIHQNPELAFEEFQTADFLLECLTEIGCDSVVSKFAETGIIAELKGSAGEGPAIALRADMDALAIEEKNEIDYKSKNGGKMHACGHDGHMAMLLGAIDELAQKRDQFCGSVYFIFQPAEENEGGGQRMVEEGLFEKFPIKEVYGMHNWPGLPAGDFALKKGPIMAAADRFDLIVKGVGGHAAMPHMARDPIITASSIVTALQHAVSRRQKPMDPVVLSITGIHGGDAYNVIPEEVRIFGSLRTLSKESRQEMFDRIESIAQRVAHAHECECEVKILKGYPSTINHEEPYQKALKAARATVGEERVDENTEASMASEDFSFLLNACPGNYMFIGNGPGEGGCLLHNPHYDFNDDVIATGVNFWVNLVLQEQGKA
jgi:hippurate hydrolase